MLGHRGAGAESLRVPRLPCASAPVPPYSTTVSQIASSASHSVPLDSPHTWKRGASPAPGAGGHWPAFSMNMIGLTGGVARGGCASAGGLPRGQEEQAEDDQQANEGARLADRSGEHGSTSLCRTEAGSDACERTTWPRCKRMFSFGGLCMGATQWHAGGDLAQHRCFVIRDAISKDHSMTGRGVSILGEGRGCVWVRFSLGAQAERNGASFAECSRTLCVRLCQRPLRTLRLRSANYCRPPLRVLR